MKGGEPNDFNHSAAMFANANKWRGKKYRMKVAAAYIRVSTDDQIEFSPDSQRKALKNYAEKNGILLPSEFIFLDEGISGKNTKKRPAFNNMIALAKTKPKPFDVILVWKYSRFARNREDSVVYKSMLRKELNIDVVSISESVGDDKMSILFEAMIEAMDEYYSINLAEEVKRGMTEKAKRGGVLSIPPFGYTVKDGQYIIIPDEAAVIQKVFNDYNNGKGFLSIAKELNAVGVKTHRGNKIENRTIEYWLNNPTYIGKTRWNPNGALSRNYFAETAIIVDSTHKPIIDFDTWNAAQERMRQQKEKYCKYYTSERKNLSHWLVGIARCEKCGAVLSNQGGHFGCSKKGKGLCEGTGYISVRKLEDIILSLLSDVMYSDVEVQIAPRQNIEQTKASEEPHKLLEIQIKRLEIRLSRVRDAYEDGIDTLEEYKANKISIISAIEQLKEKLACEIQSQAKKNAAVEIDKTKFARLTDILKDESVCNSEKNRIARTIFKEIVKGGQNGKTIKCVFWE